MGLSFCSYTSLNFVFWFSLFHLTLSHFASSRPPLCHHDERSALLQFKESFIIKTSSGVSAYPSAYPKVSSWKAEEENGDCCSWDGITCNEHTGHVVKLNLTSSYLYGSLNSSSSLFHLVHLEWLSLADNNFNDSKIPSRIMNLSRLSHLDLSYSIFSGQIPSEILELSDLVFLNVSHNYLEHQYWGDLLRSMAGALTSLKMLDLCEVNISSSIPRTLANLSSLTYLYLENCELQGEFPSEIFQLPNLHYLSVSNNPDLTIYLPEFEKSNPLEELSLAWTRVFGGIPNSLGNFKSLSIMDFSGCNISREFLSEIFLLPNLTELRLAGTRVFGGIPNSLGNLKSLSYLDMSQNLLGQIPSSLANLTHISHLDLSDNDIFGELPSFIGNLSSLKELHLSYNKLSGPIPYWLTNLNKLISLSLSYNQLTGYIPFEIKNLTQLTSLDLGSNRLEGWVSSSLFELKNLRKLDLCSNNLSGTLDIHKFHFNIKNLEWLDLSSNNLSLLTEALVYNYSQNLYYVRLSSCNLNSFPNFLQKQDQLELLDLSSNKIAGHIPRWLLNVSLYHLNLSYNLLEGFDQHPVVLPWTNLLVLDLSSNKLQGPLPFPSNSTFSYLVSKNYLTGKLPHWICSLSRLDALDLSYNNLSGVLPQCLRNFIHQLSILKLQSNRFNGSIPDIFKNGSNLMMIDLSHNLFRGRIPRSLSNCTKLEFLNLGNNQIDDIFPSWLGFLPELKVLLLQWNRFHGAIKEPETDFDFPRLHIIDLSHNRFKGNLPSKYFQCWNSMRVVNTSQLEYIRYQLNYYFSSNRGFTDCSITLNNKGIEMNYEKLPKFLTAILLSDNKFEGEIPISIGNLKGLYSLNISNNNLQGHIPSSLGNLTALELLDLSNNWLSGEIPQQLADITYLEVFNVSHNHLTGPIPEGKQFNTFDNTSYEGNPGLCGKLLSKTCENSEPPHKEVEEDEVSSSAFAFGWKIVVIGYASGLAIGLVLGHFFTARKHEWFAKTLGWQLKRVERKTRNRESM